MTSQRQEEMAEDEVEMFGGASRILETVSRPFQKLLCGFQSEPVVWDESNEYNFNHEYRGMMLIFNNEYFKTHSPRPGSALDADNLNQTFSKLGFAVRCYNNLKRDEMLSVLKKAAKEDHSRSDCFACAILSHGDEVYVVDRRRPGYREKEDLVYATDQVILTSEITRLFSDSRCPTLAGKPRLFFMQACRGDRLDPGVTVPVMRDEVDASPVQVTELVPIPVFKDFLMVYATPPGHYAFRRPDVGSWFVKGLCAVLSRLSACDQNLISLLTKVIRHVSQQYESQSTNLRIAGKKQSPCFISMLVKDVYFRRKPENHLDDVD